MKDLPHPVREKATSTNFSKTFGRQTSVYHLAVTVLPSSRGTAAITWLEEKRIANIGFWADWIRRNFAGDALLSWSRLVPGALLSGCRRVSGFHQLWRAYEKFWIPHFGIFWGMTWQSPRGNIFGHPSSNVVTFLAESKVILQDCFAYLSTHSQVVLNEVVRDKRVFSIKAAKAATFSSLVVIFGRPSERTLWRSNFPLRNFSNQRWMVLKDRFSMSHTVFRSRKHWDTVSFSQKSYKMRESLPVRTPILPRGSIFFFVFGAPPLSSKNVKNMHSSSEGLLFILWQIYEYILPKAISYDGLVYAEPDRFGLKRLSRTGHCLGHERKAFISVYSCNSMNFISMFAGARSGSHEEGSAKMASSCSWEWKTTDLLLTSSKLRIFSEHFS